MRRDDLDAIRQLSLFAEMASDNFDEMMQLAYFQWFPPQVQLINEGEPADFLHLVTKGCIELHAQHRGREATLSLVRPVTTFVLAAVLKDAVHLISARTILRSQILLIPSEHVRKMMERDTRFAHSIVMELATSHRGAIKSLKNHQLRTGTERLANYILLCLDKTGGDGKFRLDVHKRTLAGLLGMTPENLSRAFGALKSYGVRVEGRIITIETVSDLHRLARPTPLIDDHHS